MEIKNIGVRNLVSSLEDISLRVSIEDAGVGQTGLSPSFSMFTSSFLVSGIMSEHFDLDGVYFSTLPASGETSGLANYFVEVTETSLRTVFAVERGVDIVSSEILLEENQQREFQFADDSIPSRNVVRGAAEGYFHRTKTSSVTGFDDPVTEVFIGLSYKEPSPRSDITFTTATTATSSIT